MLAQSLHVRDHEDADGGQEEHQQVTHQLHRDHRGLSGLLAVPLGLLQNYLILKKNRWQHMCDNTSIY